MWRVDRTILQAGRICSPDWTGLEEEEEEEEPRGVVSVVAVVQLMSIFIV